MEYVLASEKQFRGGSDSETIQNAVDYAEKTGICEVVIPRINERNGTNVWNIEKAILLPSDMTIILNNCHLRLADGVFDNIFRNKNCLTDIGKTLEGEQYNINIIGQGSALLDGGELNGLCEQAVRDDPEHNPPMHVNLLIFFANVRNFKIENFSVKNSRWWALCFNFSRFGTVRNIHFSMHATMENQDGIDLRAGCEYITIENITGITGDDTIALTALPESDMEKSLRVEGKTIDIHDITVSHVCSSSHGCGIIRFLCEDGAKIYSVTVDDVKDTGRSITSAAFIMGTSGNLFLKKSQRKMGEFRDITIRNVRSCGQRVFSIAEPCENLLIENVSAFGKTEAGIYFTRNFYAKNVQIRNFYFAPETTADCFIYAKTEDCGGLADMRIENVKVCNADYVFRIRELPVENLRYEAPKKAYFTAEAPVFTHPYGRYFRYFNGKEITNRPADNRFTSTTEEDDL